MDTISNMANKTQNYAVKVYGIAGSLTLCAIAKSTTPGGAIVKTVRGYLGQKYRVDTRIQSDGSYMTYVSGGRYRAEVEINTDPAGEILAI